MAKEPVSPHLDTTDRAGIRRWLAGSLSGLACFLVVAVLVATQTLLAAPGAGATTSFSINRLSGTNRFATAAAIARATYPSGAGTVLLATGTTFPDALSGNFLAGNLGAPILLTTPGGPTPAPTLQALAAMHTKEVLILGGTAAVNAAQASALGHLGYQVKRVAGANRYETMRMVAEYPGTKVGADASGVPTAIVASATNFPDALSAGPLSFAAKLPVILTDGASNKLSPVAAQTLKALHIGHVLSLGGSAAINPAVNSQIGQMGIVVTHLAGPNRSATSLAVARQEVTKWGFSTKTFTLARGDDFADALAAGPAAGAQGEPLLITSSPSDPGSVGTYATDYATTLTSGDAFGGSGALTGGLLSGLVQTVLDALAPPTPPPSSCTSAQPGAASGSGSGTTGSGSAGSGSTGAPAILPVTTTPCIDYPPPPHPAGSPFPNGGLGFDISWPQCPNMVLPNGPSSFDIIGVNDGHAYSINPCLQAQAAWAGSSLSLVMNLNIPIPSWDNNMANHLQQGPDAACAAIPKNIGCQYYDYGYNAAISSMADAALYSITSKVWWLDIEAPHSQLWSDSTIYNGQVIQGAIDALHNAGHVAAVYSTSYQWGQITGSYAPGVPTWVATGTDPSNLADWCGSSHAFGGGTTWMVQFGRGSFDGDYSC
ncbi:MAG: cell wall-binding repeat-containing protein [Acidimicrobiales bacterium]